MKILFSIAVLGLGIAVAADPGAEPVWRCENEQGRVAFQDRPCREAAAEARRVGSDQGAGTFSTIPAGDYPDVAPARPEAPERTVERRESARAAERAAGRRECGRYEMRLEAIQRKLRKGYGAAEGNRLRAERRRIEGFMHDHCD